MRIPPVRRVQIYAADLVYQVPIAFARLHYFTSDWGSVSNPHRALFQRVLFPSGIRALSNRVTQTARLPFGIWCEIEAVGVNALLNQTHPHIIAQREGKPLEYICMGSAAAREWAHSILAQLVEEYGAKWIKLDFNLDPGLGCDCEAHGHGTGDGLWAHYQGYYLFLDQAREKYPDLVLENCSSGGLRTEHGLMKHCHYLKFFSTTGNCHRNMLQ